MKRAMGDESNQIGGPRGGIFPNHFLRLFNNDNDDQN